VIRGLRSARAAVGPAVVVVASVGAAVAQRTEFDPSISLLWSRTDNVAVVESSADPDASTDTADQYTNLAVWLPVTRTARFGSLSFSYSGAYSRYDRNTVYDHLAHTASIGISPRLRRNATLSAELFYTLSQEQGTPSRIDQEEQFLTVRTDRTFYGTSVRYEKDGRRAYRNASLRASRSEFAVIEGTLPDSPPSDPTALQLVPENRTYWYGNFEFRRKFSRRFSLGPRYELAYADLGRTPDEVVHVLSLAFGWTVSQYFSFDATTGVAHRTSEDDPLTGLEGQSETEFAWILNLRIDPPLAAIQKGKIKLGLDLGISPSGGGALPGTSTNSYVRLYLASGTRRSRWSWDVGTRYTRRESTLDTVPTVETTGIEGFVQYGIGSLISFRVGGGWSGQLNADSQATNASFRTAQAGVVIYPKGKIGSGRS
jgi:hypothetical protein